MPPFFFKNPQSFKHKGHQAYSNEIIPEAHKAL